jgi:RNA polymerase sigma factor (TIGR02999 family)
MNDDIPPSPETEKVRSLAAADLIDLAYSELRRLAASKMSREAPGQTLQSTALLHEAWLRLSEDPDRRFASRTHFFAAAAEAMRRILIDRARRRQAARHGGGCERVPLDAEAMVHPAEDESLVALDEALEKLTLTHAMQAEVVKLRYFGGMTNDEIAECLGLSSSTVKNYWVFAKAWIFDSMRRR